MRSLILMLLLLPMAATASMRDLDRLHRQAMSQHTYITDLEQYGVPEKWVASLVGDCEDYALYMQALLRQHGYQADLWVVRTETNELHVVAMVDDIVIDNRRQRAFPARFFNYDWIAPVEYHNAKNRQLLAMN